MHKILDDKIKYNLIYQIQQMIYSSIIPIKINTILKFLSLSEEPVL